MRLQIKVGLLVISILLVVGVLFGGLMLYFQSRASENQFRETAVALAGAVQGSLEQGMMLGETGPIQKALVRVAEQDIVSQIALFAPNGLVAASSDTSEIGSIEAQIASILVAFGQGEKYAVTQNGHEAGTLSIVTPVSNKEECQTCHDPQTTTLGAIEVSLDTTMIREGVKQQTMYLGILGGSTFLLIGGVLALALRRTILNPLSSLAESAQRIAAGDYEARAESLTNDEIGTLARTFNEMAENVDLRNRELEASRQELARWNTDLESKIQRRTNQLSALNAIITIVSQSLSLDRVLNNTLTMVLAIVEMDGGAVHLLNDKGDVLSVTVHRGLSPEYLEQVMNLQPGQDVMGRVVQSAEAVVVTDTMENSKAARVMGEKGEFRAYISLPVKSKNRVLGTLSLASYLPNKFEPETLHLLWAMGEAMGIAVENSRAGQSLEEANKVREELLKKLITAQEEERRRISRELHDEASQSLAALAFNLEGIAEGLPPRHGDTRRKIELLKDQLIQTLEGIRNLAIELRPSVLDDLGLALAVDWYAKDFLTKRGIDIKVEISGGEAKLPAYTQTLLFRIMQEALTNVARHAKASQVKLKLELSGQSAVMEIHDNGRGFDVKAAMSGEGMRRNLGIHSMSERATLLGGTFTVISEPGQGTYLRIEVPLAEGAVVDG